MFRLLAGSMTIAILAHVSMAADTTQESDIDQLQLKLKQLRQSFGKDHPKIVSIRKKIGLIQRLGAEAKQLPEHQAILDRLSPMLLEEQELISKFGKAHPKVKAIRGRIEFTTKFFSDKLKLSSEAAKKTGKTNSPHDAFLKMLPMLVKEQELIAKYGEKHPSVANIRKQLELARRNVAANSPTKRVPGRTGQVPENDNSPGVDDDADKPGRYTMETQNGNIILLDRATGRTWMMKTGAKQPEWIPIQRGRKKP